MLSTGSVIARIGFVNRFLKRSRETAGVGSCGTVGHVQWTCFMD
jgi:hypothetical protein